MLDALGPLPPARERLRGLLAPLFARSADEQRRFYEIFDRYWLEISDLSEPQPIPPTRISWQETATRIGAILLAAAAGWYLWLILLPPTKPLRPEPEFSLNADSYQPGDTAHCLNHTRFEGADSSDYTYDWSIEHQDGSLVMRGPQSFHWSFIVPPPDSAYGQQTVVLRQHHKTDRSVRDFAVYQYLNIACANRPALPRIWGSANAQKDRSVLLKAAPPAKPGLRYTWAVGDTSITGTTFRYVFNKTESVPVLFSVSDTTQPGLCARDTTIYLEIPQPVRVIMPFKTLQYDQAEPVAEFRWPVIFVLLAVGLGALWYWVRWLRRKTPESASEREAALPRNWALAADSPPYYVPFREQKGVLKNDAAQFRLGDAMRIRQEGDDAELDVPASLRATVEGGGYPGFRFRFRTRPSEYLFLIDEQMPGKHLARMFRQLAETLRGREVLLEILWYDRDFLYFRPENGQKGVRIDQLRRLYPQHRLVLMGDGHHLLDHFEENTRRLRPGLAAELAGWKERLLLTPQAPDAWNWREQTLYRHFGIFPADLRGLLDAAFFVEEGLDAEDLPPQFETWQAQQTALRDEKADTNYRRWRSLRDHEDYLRAAAPGAYADLRRWLCALAVLPNPAWEITLAVAAALGINVTHDRLLVLARIPWLQDGQLHPRLRRELLAALDEGDERLARAALEAELEAARPLTAGSHAAHELESALAIQQFLLRPDSAEHQNLIAVLLDTGALTRVQEDELNLAVERWDGQKQAEQPQKASTSNLADVEKRGIRTWLAERSPEAAEAPRRPFFTRDFGFAAALTTLLLLSGGFAYRYAGTKELRDMVFRERSFAPERDTLRENIFLKETVEVDSAKIYNNLGCGLLSAYSYYGIYNKPDFELADSFFQKSIYLTLLKQVDGQTPSIIAAKNQGKNLYNKSAWSINYDLYNEIALKAAYNDFLKATSPPFLLADDDENKKDRLDALHGQGLASYYLNNREYASVLYNKLAKGEYFDTLSWLPNLQTLLGIQPRQGITVSLQWQGRDDLDLLVIDPTGHITGLNDTVFSRGSYKIALEKGANGSIRTAVDAPEEIITIKNAISGTYQVIVSMYKKREKNPITPFTLLVKWESSGAVDNYSAKISEREGKVLITKLKIADPRLPSQISTK